MEKILRLTKKIIKGLVLGIYYLVTKLFPVDRNIVVFESNIGRNYSGNPKAIYEKMVELGLDRKYQIYWILEDVNLEVLGSARKIKKDSFRFYYIMAVSGLWVSDSRFPRYIVKRKKCTYIQTWHGTPLKKLGLDMDDVYMAGGKNVEYYKEQFVKNTGTWDYLISQNYYSTKIFERAFDFKKEFLEIGYPRNDVLFEKNNRESMEQLKKKLKLPQDKKIILYAPTWRDNEFYDVGKYRFNPSLDFEQLRKELSEEYILIVKYHYLIMDQVDWTAYKGFIYAFDMSYDISMLYLVSDILMTDYSSVMFDYSILKRPMVFYCYDLEGYRKELRGFYFDFIQVAPGPIIEESDALVKYLKGFDTEQYEEDYKEKYDRFSKEYNHLDDGMASERVVELIESL